MVINCKFCGTEFDKKPSQMSKSGNNFCSQSCSAKYHNSNPTPRILKGRKKLQGSCINCQTPININRKYCKTCRPIFWNRQDITIGELIYSKGHRSNAFNHIRGRARTVAKNLGFKSCLNCGYDKHIEVCHKRDISDFPETAHISEVNSPDNLIPLCPNCHWEFDNGILVLSGQLGNRTD